MEKLLGKSTKQQFKLLQIISILKIILIPPISISINPVF